MDRPAVGDMKSMLYFPASVDDPRNETHGYTLGTDDDVSHESCDDDAYVHTSLLSHDVQTHNSRIAAFGRPHLNITRRTTAL